ncbi:hypothetical protein E2C01_049859 [Portunus trituberculatus]|uniref:Uncharacterized protein n=1 Tax=Portunus trituberculatus TaxID=210409 RepID=A0A5B7GH90_PORTR|nr:hypothetical protein [Portunus trituberculatus]
MRLCYWPWLLPFRGYNWIRVLKPGQTPAHRPLVNTSLLFKLVPCLTGKAASLGSCCFSPYLHLLPLLSPCRTPASGLHLPAYC